MTQIVQPAVLIVFLIGAICAICGCTQANNAESRTAPPRNTMPLLDPGVKAPDFNLPDQTGKHHSLRQYAGRPVVLFFYPKDDTPGCTKEACAFRDLLPKFSPPHGKAVIFGVSPDDEKSHADFAAKFKLNFTLLADVPSGKGQSPPVCERYGVWQEKSMYGKKYMGVARTTYLIDKAGAIAQRWDKVNVDGHAEEVLAAIAVLK